MKIVAALILISAVSVHVLAQDSAPYTFNAGGATTITTPGVSSTLSTGYGRLQTTAGVTPAGFEIFGLRQGGVLVTEAAVPASARVTSGRIYAEVVGSVNTGLAIANPNAQAATLSFYFTDASGVSSGSGSLSIPAGAQIAKFLDQPPFNAPRGLRGTLTFVSSEAVCATALRGLTNERNEFLITTLPVVDLKTVNSSELIFPHYADGGGWTTQLVLVNPGDLTISGTIRFYGSISVASLPETINVATSFNTYGYSLPPRSSKRLVTGNGPAEAKAGFIKVTPASGSTSPSGVVIFSFRPGNVTLSEAGVPFVPAGSAFRMYAQAVGNLAQSQPGSAQTGIGIANLNPESATVYLELFTMSGERTGLGSTLTLLPLGQAAAFLYQIPGFEALPQSFQGILRISTSQRDGISVIGLRARVNERRDWLIATTAPVEESAAATSTELIFPHLADSAGYTSEFILFGRNASSASNGKLNFVSTSGAPLQIAAQSQSANSLAAGVTDTNGVVTLSLGNGKLKFRFTDQPAGKPAPLLSVGVAVDQDTGRGVLMAIDPADKYPPQIIVLKAQSVARATAADGAFKAADEEPPAVSVGIDTLLNSVIGEVTLSSIPGVKTIAESFSGYRALMTVVAKQLDSSGIPLGKYAGKFSDATVEELSASEAFAGIRSEIRENLRNKFIMFAASGGTQLPFEAAGVAIDALTFAVDANAVWNCTLANENVTITTFKVSGVSAMKVYGCKQRGINIADAVPFVTNLVDPLGIGPCSGSLDLISTSGIGLGYRAPISGGRGSATVKTGSYQTNVRCPGYEPKSVPTIVPPGGTTLTVVPSPPGTTPPPPAPPVQAVASVNLIGPGLTGFLDPGTTLQFSAVPLDANGNIVVGATCTFAVSNPVGTAVASINPATGLLLILNGQGAVSVTVTCKGPSGGTATSAPRLVSGRGGSTPSPTPPPPTSNTTFDGAYSGSYSGSATVDGYSASVSGAVAFTIANGVLTMTVPGSGTGTVSASGGASFGVSGGVAVEGASCRYDASFRLTGSGAAGSGTWSCTLEGGSASGSWNATRR